MAQANLQRAIDAARRAEASHDPVALGLWESVVRIDPSHFVAWSKIGRLQALRGDTVRSVFAFEAAVRASPFQAVLHYNLGRSYFSANRPYDAVAAYRSAIQLAPNNPDPYFGWIEALGSHAPPLEILQVCEAAITAGVSHPGIAGEKSKQLIRCRQFDRAELCIRNALASWPDEPILHELHASALIEQGDSESALRAATKAAALDPTSKGPLLTRLTVLIHSGRAHEAIEELNLLDSSSGDDPDLLKVRGTALVKLHRFKEAVPILTQSCQQDGGDVGLWEAFGVALGASHQPVAAADCFSRADQLLIEAKVEADTRLRFLSLRMNFLAEGHLFKECVECCDEISGLVRDSSFVSARLAYSLAMLADWVRLPEARLELLTAAQRGRGDCSPFSLCTFFDDPILHREYAMSHSQIGCGKLTREQSPPHRRTPRPLRVGYMSPDFRDHPVGRLMVALFEHHDHQQIEPVALSTWLQLDGEAESDVTKRIRDASSAFIELGERDDEGAAQLIRSIDLDVVVDLCGHTLGARPGIFAHGCAPLQMQYLGYPGTTGASFMDAMIADAHVIPPGEEHLYTERILRLPHSYLPPGDRPPVVAKLSRRELGLPDQALVLGAFHSTYKISPEVFDCWVQLLQACPSSILWVNIHDAPARAAITQTAAAAGIESHRVIFAEREADIGRHLARMGQVDLMLDTFPYGSHSAALDALWAGAPILACEGRSFASRVCSGLLRELGLSSLITHSLEEYTRRGSELLSDPAQLSALRQQLLAQKSNPVFDAKAHARGLEDALLQFVREREEAHLDA
jgi:predicted O-linked N-acetylglucosamine transferase (SPINDLY family)